MIKTAELLMAENLSWLHVDMDRRQYQQEPSAVVPMSTGTAPLSVSHAGSRQPTSAASL